MLIQFDDTDAVIEIPDEAEFAGILRAAAFDWPFREVSRTDQPIASVRRKGERFEVAAAGEETIEVAAVSAACSVIVDAVKAFIDVYPARLCLHCGSVLFSGRLVVFPSRFRAGKSTLVARLAAGDHIVFGDDVLPLDETDARGVAMGIAPRLRVPLPANALESFRAFAERHAVARDHRYHYLNPPERLARRGTAAPLGAVVLLDRRADGPAELFQASRGAALQSLIVQNFARAGPAGDLLERMHRLIERLPCFTLRYSALDDAAAILERTFACRPPRAQVHGVADPPLTGPAQGEDGSVNAAMPVGRRTRMQQNSSIRLRSVDGDLFLADAEGWGIHQLNSSGAGVWKLLAQPICVEEAIEVFRGAFPDADRATVEKDVEALFAALYAEGFIVEADQSADCIGNRAAP